MHHSIIPYEAVFAQDSPDGSAQPYMTTKYQGVKMDVSRQNDGTCRIERIYSTDPKLFMKKELQIGTMIQIPMMQK